MVLLRVPRDPVPRTGPWATEENFWLEGPDFYRARMATDAAMWFPDRAAPLKGEAIIDALQNAPRWERVRFSDKSMTVEDDRITLRYHAVARRNGRDAYAADCETTYLRDSTGLLRLVEHRQRAA